MVAREPLVRRVGRRVIVQGLKPDEWVVVGALQQVRPRMPVRPEEITMPSLLPPATGEAPHPDQPM